MSARPRRLKAQLQFERLLRALIVYKSLHGTANVPPTFTVPDSSAWPEALVGYKLGSHVRRQRSRAMSPQQDEALREIGFVFSHSDHLADASVSGLHAFHRQFGHLRYFAQLLLALALTSFCGSLTPLVHY